MHKSDLPGSFYPDTDQQSLIFLLYQFIPLVNQANDQWGHALF
jgi:hypothetical protein